VQGSGCRNPNMQEKQDLKTLVQGSGCCNPDMQEKQGVVTLAQGSGCRNPDMQDKQCLKTSIQGSRCRNHDMQEKQGVVTLVQGSGCRNPDMQEKQGLKTLVQGLGCRNSDMKRQMPGEKADCVLSLILFIHVWVNCFIYNRQIHIYFQCFYEIEECHTYWGVMLKMLTWLSLSKYTCTLARVHWKLKDVWEDFKETEITMWAHHFSYTPKRGCNLWMSGWKTQETQKLPQFWYMGKACEDMDQWVLWWDIHVKPGKLPQLWYS